MDDKQLRAVRGEQASQILQNPVFEKAFDDVRKAILETWAQLDAGNQRHFDFAADLHRMVRCLDRVKVCLTKHVEDGQIAQRDIEGKKNLFGRRS